MSEEGMSTFDLLRQFEDYQKIVLPKLYAFCESGKTKYNGSIEVLKSLYLLLCFIVDNEKIYLPNNANKAVSLQYNKNAGIVLAVKSCLENGQLLAASSLIRDLFEILLDTSILTEQDAEERAQLYLNYGFVQQWLHIKKHKKNIEMVRERYGEGPEHEDTISYYRKLIESDMEKQVNNNYERVKKDYHPTAPYHWAWKIFKTRCSGQKPSVEFLAKEYNIYDDYIKIYSLYSLSVHNSPLAKSMLMQGDTITCAPNYSGNIISLTAVCFDLASKISMLIVRHSGSGYYDQIKEVLDRIFLEAY